MTTLRAGVSRKTISPPSSIYLSGYGNRVQGNVGIHDDLFATTLVLDDGNSRAALITVDHTFIHPRVIEQVKAGLPDLPADAIFVCCSHTHAGPIGYADEQSPQQDRDYIAFLVSQLVASVIDASADLQIVNLFSGQSEAFININRRERTPDGKIIIGNNPSGPVDHSVQAVQVRTEQDILLATLVNYACHPVVMGPLNRLVSADWVGAMRRSVEAETGSPCLFIQGATGDVNPRKMRWAEDSWDEVEEQGGEVAHAVVKACKNMESLVIGPIQARQAECWLPLIPPKGYNDDIRALLPAVKTAEEIRAAIHAGFPWQVDVAKRDGILYSPVQIGFMRVGDWALMALGAEPFTESGLALKAASPTKVTFIAGYTNGCNSYLPVASAYAEGGYEVETAALFYGMPSGFAQGGAEATIAEVKKLFER
jgi:neutral ceramidase